MSNLAKSEHCAALNCDRQQFESASGENISSSSSSSSFGCSIKGRHSGYIRTEDLAVFLRRMPFLTQPTDSRET